MQDINERLLRLEELSLRLSALSGEVAREILDIRSEMASRPSRVDEFLVMPDGTAATPRVRKASLDVHVETTIDDSKVAHRYVRFVELPSGDYTQHVVGLDDKGQPVGVRTTHGEIHDAPEEIPLIPATRERLKYVGWTDQTAPRKAGEGGWKRLS